jgi:hypothetical protein
MLVQFTPTQVIILSMVIPLVAISVALATSTAKTRKINAAEALFALAMPTYTVK